MITAAKSTMKTTARLFVAILTLTCTQAGQRIALIGDDRSTSANHHLAPDMVAAALVSQFDCEVVLRFESSSVLLENTIGGQNPTVDVLPSAPAVDHLAYVQQVISSIHMTLQLAKVEEGIGNREEMINFSIVRYRSDYPRHCTGISHGQVVKAPKL